MTGHLNEQDVIDSIVWPDAELEEIKIDYDNVHVTIKQTNGVVCTVTGSGYIGYRAVGFWDEVVVDSASLHDKHSFIDECTESISRRFGESVQETGNQVRNTRNWSLLSISLIDGCQISIVAARITAEIGV